MLDTFRYGVCYYPEAWSPDRLASDVRRIRDCGFDVVRMGEGAWGYWEPREGEYQFDLFDRAIDLCRRNGIKVVLGTPTYCGPAWISSNYPEVLRWNFDRVPMRHGSRRHFNYTSPKYLDLSDKVCAALAEHYKDDPQVIGWQLDNEFNCHMDVSYAPSDTLAFRIWLREKYGTLDALNAAWGTRFWSQQYDAWEQVDLPHPTVTWMNPTQLLDESRFVSDCVVKFARRQAAVLRARNPGWKITHNGLFANVDGPAWRRAGLLLPRQLPAVQLRVARPGLGPGRRPQPLVPVRGHGTAIGPRRADGLPPRHPPPRPARPVGVAGRRPRGQVPALLPLADVPLRRGAALARPARPRRPRQPPHRRGHARRRATPQAARRLPRHAAGQGGRRAPRVRQRDQRPADQHLRQGGPGRGVPVGRRLRPPAPAGRRRVARVRLRRLRCCSSPRT